MDKERKGRSGTPAYDIYNDTDGGFRRLKQKNSVRQLRQRVYYFLLLTVLLLIFVLGIVALFFRVNEVKVTGNTEYTDKEIIKASGIEKGENIYFVKEADVRKEILTDFPYVRSVSVERNVPNKINIRLKCDSPDYYVDICGEYYVISANLKVLERFFSKEELLAAHPEIKLFKTGDIRSAIVGNEMEFLNSNHAEVAKDFLGELSSAEIFEGVSSISFEDRFNIRVVYDSRLAANVGNGDDAELKLRFLNEIVKDLGNSKGSIDVKDVETAYVLLDGTASYD